MTPNQPPPLDDHEDNPFAALVDGASFIFDHSAAVEPIWGTAEQVLWATGESLIITGTTGVGKTTIAQRLVLSLIGVGGPVLEFPTRPTDRVLYLAMDRPRQIARSFGRMVTKTHGPELAKRLTFWKGPPPADIAKAPGLLHTMARYAHADTLVIDSLKDAAVGLTDDAVGAGVNRALQTVLAAGINVLVLHHQTKRSGTGNGGAPTQLSDVYGSAFITAGAGSVILLDGEAGAPNITLRHLKQPAEPVGPLKITFDRHAGTITLDDDNLDPLKWLRTQRGPITAQHLAYATTPNPTKADIERARRDLERLTRTGHANKNPGTKGGPGGGTPTTYTPTAPPHQQTLDPTP